MQVVFELFPLILFVIVLVTRDILAATAVLMIAVLVQLALYKLMSKPISKMTLTAAGILFVFGGLTLILRDDTFIKWKPTVVYWLFAAVFLISQFVGEKNLAQRIYQTLYEEAFEGKIHFSPGLWTRLNLFWVVAFLLMGVANYYAFQLLDTVSWGYFKLFMVVVLFLLTIGQTIYVVYKGQKREGAEEY